MYYTVNWYNLWPIGIVCDHLVFFSRFGMFVPRKIWQPSFLPLEFYDCELQLQRWRIKTYTSVFFSKQLCHVSDARLSDCVVRKKLHSAAAATTTTTTTATIAASCKVTIWVFILI
jgi:hypothetical protein